MSNEKKTEKYYGQMMVCLVDKNSLIAEAF